MDKYKTKDTRRKINSYKQQYTDVPQSKVSTTNRKKPKKKAVRKKRAPSAWNLFVRKTKQDNKAMKMKDVMRLARKLWKQKKSTTTNKPQSKVSTVNRQKKKTPIVGTKKKKRAPSAWNLFVRKTKQENPNLKMKDVMKLAGKKWREKKNKSKTGGSLLQDIKTTYKKITNAPATIKKIITKKVQQGVQKVKDVVKNTGGLKKYTVKKYMRKYTGGKIDIPKVAKNLFPSFDGIKNHHDAFHAINNLTKSQYHLYNQVAKHLSSQDIHPFYKEVSKIVKHDLGNSIMSHHTMTQVIDDVSRANHNQLIDSIFGEQTDKQDEEERGGSFSSLFLSGVKTVGQKVHHLINNNGLAQKYVSRVSKRGVGAIDKVVNKIVDKQEKKILDMF